MRQAWIFYIVQNYCHVVGKVIVHRSRGGVEQDQLKMFVSLFKIQNDFLKIFFLVFFTFILCNFLVRTLHYWFFLKEVFLGHENIKKNCPQKLLIIRPNFFVSIANQPKTSLNLNFCSIEIAHRMTYVSWLWQ